jgi:transposase-like protein
LTATATVWVPIEIANPTMEKPTTMADKVSMALAEMVRKAEADGDVDFLKERVRVLSQALMEVEVAQHIGAERYERTGERKWTAECVSRPDPGHARRHAGSQGATGA